MKIIISLFVTILFSQISKAGILQFETTNINAQTAQRMQPFLDKVESQLPKEMWEKLASEKITVIFSQMDKSNQIVLPNCSNVVDSISEANGVKAQFKSASARKDGVRYNQQVHSYVSKNSVVLNSAFMNIILNGESSAQGYMCDLRNTYRLAEGALIHGLATIYNKESGQRVRDANERSVSTEKISDRLQYKYIAGWNNKKLMQSFWPRALNPYEYAGDTADHFAYNMEFFILDPEYACRRPLLHDYLSKTVGQDRLSSLRHCTVNTEIKIPYEYSQPMRDAATGESYDETKTDLKTYDLNPDRVYNVYYIRASMGAGISGFGHSMFRVVVCPPNMSLSKDCERTEDYDLVFNPRANANEMKLDNMKGLFGGYPSQFLVNSMYDLEAEYGDGELRHLFNMPMGYMNDQGQFVDVMPQDQKNRFIWAALENYWAYYGNYKFISNNCSDETLRLYQMSSDDPAVLKLSVLKPSDVNKKLSKLGYVDDTEVKKYEKTPGLIGKIFGKGKIKNQQEYDTRRAAIESGRYKSAFVSKIFDIEDAVRAIMKMEGNPNPDFKSAQKEIKKWLDLATPDYKWSEEMPSDISKITDDQKKEILSSTFYEIKARYDNLINLAKTQKQKDLVTFYFFRIMYHVYNKRAEDVGNKAIQIAYAVAYPSKDRSVKEMPKDVKISKEQYETIRSAVDKYSQIQAQLMPYMSASVKMGYGIPLKSDVVRGEQYLQLKNQEAQSVSDVIVSLVGLLGPEHVLLQEIGDFYNDLLAKRMVSAAALNPQN